MRKMAKHKKKSKKFLGMFAGSSLLALLVIAGVFFLFQETILGETVYMPTWGHMYCGECNAKSKGSWDVTAQGNDVPNAFYCGAENLAGYFPDGCDYTLKILDSRLQKDTAYRVCTINDSSCLEKRGTFRDTRFSLVSDATTNIHITDREYLVIRYDILFDPFGLFDKGDIVVSTISSGYCIYHQERGNLQILSHCDIRALTGSFLEGDKAGVEAMKNNGTLTPTMGVIRWIVASTPSVDNRDVIMYNGEKIYVYSPYNYYKIEQAEDGRLFANTETSYYDKSLECMPSQPYCSADGKTVVDNPSGKPCNEVSGSIIGYVPIGGGKGDLFVCENGELVAQGKEIIYPDGCPPGEFFDSMQGKCIKNVIPPPPVPTPPDIWQWLTENIPYIIGIGIALILILFLFKTGSGGGQVQQQPQQPIIITK